MSQLDMVMDELKQLPPAKVRQVAEYVHQLRETQSQARHAALAETAGRMTPGEADQFQQLIDDYCERIETASAPRLD